MDTSGTNRIVCTRARRARRISEKMYALFYSMLVDKMLLYVCLVPIMEKNVNEQVKVQKPYWRKKRYSVNNESDCDGNVRYLFTTSYCMTSSAGDSAITKKNLANLNVYPNRIFYSLYSPLPWPAQNDFNRKKKVLLFLNYIHAYHGVVYALLEVHCTTFLCGIWQHTALGCSKSVYGVSVI